jgi:hypothetical protein
MLLAAALQVYGDTLSVDPTPPPWATVLGLEGPRDVRDFCAAMVPVALVADAIRHAEARADIGRRVVAGARVGGVDGIRDALRSGLLEPEIDLLPPVAIDHNVAAVAGRSDRGRFRCRRTTAALLRSSNCPRGKWIRPSWMRHWRPPGSVSSMRTPLSGCGCASMSSKPPGRSSSRPSSESGGG